MDAREKGQSTTTPAINEAATKVFFRFVEEEEIAKERVIKVHADLEHDDNLPNIFLLPGVEGMYKSVRFLGSNLKGNVYCLQYGYENREDSIEDIAEGVLEVKIILFY